MARSRVPIATGNEGKTMKKTKTRCSMAWFTQFLLADLRVAQCSLRHLGVVHACVVGFDSGCLGLAGAGGVVLASQPVRAFVVMHDTNYICVDIPARVPTTD